MLTVHVAKIAFDTKVRAELLNAQLLQRNARNGRHVRERNASLAGEFWRIEQRRPCPPNLRRARLRSAKGPASNRTLRISRRPSSVRTARKIDHAAPRGSSHYFDSGILQLARFGRIECRRRENEKIVIRCLDDA